MSEQRKAVEEILVSRLLRLNAVAQGLVAGLVLGFVVFAATNWLVLKGGPVVGPHLGLLGNYFLGYEVTFLGSLIGFVWGFATGFVGGYAAARIYNAIVGLRDRSAGTG
jgi:hypothetical protein